MTRNSRRRASLILDEDVTKSVRTRGAFKTFSTADFVTTVNGVGKIKALAERDEAERATWSSPEKRSGSTVLGVRLLLRFRGAARVGVNERADCVMAA